MDDYLISFFSILILASVHFFAPKMEFVDRLTHGKFLSIGGGIAIAYIFIDLLPNLSESDKIIRHYLSGIFPYFERHVYVLALCGFLLFFIADRAKTFAWEEASRYLSLGSYALLNFFIGYAIAYKDDPSIQPLALFTLAMALHYFTNDYSLMQENAAAFMQYGKWVLILFLTLGWAIGNLFVISDAAVALINAFIAGGVIMNVTRHELPADNPNSTESFLLGSFFYTLVLLAIGR